MTTFLAVLLPVALLLLAVAVLVGGGLGKVLAVVAAILAGVDCVLVLLGK